MIPAPIIEIEGPLIIVDKSAHRLYLYDGLDLVKDFRITTGKRRGNKFVEDDLKTPEGIYFLTEFLEDEDLPAKYGARAIVLDYPNPIDKFQGKTGYGIWVHGTNDPPRLERPYDSRGCVVMLNDDVLDLAERIALLKTPVVIVEEIATVS
ncbi:MAG: L,D-transpeptidase, partial [Thermodesulfobacteriota bacterium]